MTRQVPTIGPLLRRLLVTAAAVVVAVLVAPGIARAHPTLLFTTPVADTAEATSPSTVVLVFNEPVTVAPDALVVRDAAGRQVPVVDVASGRGGRAVTGRIGESLPAGVYMLRWRVTGADGDLVESSFRFAVGPAIAMSGGAGSAGGAGTSWLSAALRWLLLAGLALALGGSAGARWTGAARAARPSLPALSRWPQAAGIGAGLLGAVQLGVAFAIAAGAGPLVSSTPGRVLLVEMAAFAGAGLALARGGRWVWLPLLAVPVAEGLRGHAAQAAPGWGAVTTVVHLAAAALWVGALVHVVQTAVRWRAVPAAVWWTVTGYARWAVWLFAIVVTTGTLSALILVPLPAITTTTYGRTLLVKLALVAAAAAAAVTARWWLRRGQIHLPRIAAATRVEAGVLAGVLAVTAVLTATPPARDAQPAFAPPPPVGVVLPWASLAGQIGVAVAASDGQLVVRLATPRRGDYYAPTGEAPAYRLSATVVPPGQPARQVRLRGCGEGCFVAPVGWGAGDNLLTLRAAATGWTGGTVGAVLPWPVQPAPERLAAAVEAMNRAGDIILYEAVTSDTSTAMREPTELHRSGAGFVSREPYGAGIAPQVVALRREGDTTRLAVGFPAEGRYAELVLDAQHRIVEETLVDAKHLIRRRFVYPGG